MKYISKYVLVVKVHKITNSSYFFMCQDRYLCHSCATARLKLDSYVIDGGLNVAYFGVANFLVALKVA